MPAEAVSPDWSRPTKWCCCDPPPGMEWQYLELCNGQLPWKTSFIYGLLSCDDDFILHYPICFMMFPGKNHKTIALLDMKTFCFHLFNHVHYPSPFSRSRSRRPSAPSPCWGRRPSRCHPPRPCRAASPRSWNSRHGPWPRPCAHGRQMPEADHVRYLGNKKDGLSAFQLGDQGFCNILVHLEFGSTKFDNTGNNHTPRLC